MKIVLIDMNGVERPIDASKISDEFEVFTEAFVFENEHYLRTGPGRYTVKGGPPDSKRAAAHEMYTLQRTPVPERCPVCGHHAALYAFTAKPGNPVSYVASCERSAAIGPQAGMAYEGCLLYMPNDDHYRATAREALAYWRDFAKALTEIREQAT